MKNIKIFILEDIGNKKQFKFYDQIDEKEYQRIYEILKRNKIANFKNTDDEFYINSNIIEFFDLVEDIMMN